MPDQISADAAPYDAGDPPGHRPAFAAYLNASDRIQLAADLDDARAALRTAAGAADRFRDVLADALGHHDNNPGDDTLIAELRAHFGRTGPEPTRWRDALTGYRASVDQINADRAALGSPPARAQDARDPELASALHAASSLPRSELLPEVRRVTLAAHRPQGPDGSTDRLAAALDTWAHTWHRRRLGHGATPAQPIDIALLAAYDAHQAPTADRLDQADLHGQLTADLTAAHHVIQAARAARQTLDDALTTYDPPADWRINPDEPPASTQVAP